MIMMVIRFPTFVSLLLLGVVVTAANNNNNNNKRNQVNNKKKLFFEKDVKDMPSTGQQWQSLVTSNSDNGDGDGIIEFQPASSNLSPLAEYHLRKLTSSSSGGGSERQRRDHHRRNLYRRRRFGSDEYEKPYVDGQETYYDEYAQAWRALGFYIDCTTNGDGGDGGDDGSSSCQRFLLWAAYIDEEYEGGGVNEYAYYNRHKHAYDYTACDAAGDKGARCVKMDCHESNTHFSLLGFFKQADPDDWMEQLFKHEGYCVFDDDEYSFMSNELQAWPQGCTQTNTPQDGDGDASGYLYYDIKPLEYGDISVGIYTDSSCLTEYTGSLSIDEVLKGAYNEYNDNNNNDDEGENRKLDDTTTSLSLVDRIKKWNNAFDVFKQCQPCMAYDLTQYITNNDYNAAEYQGDRDGDYENNDNGSGDGDNYYFHCYDPAGYNNVNQCMKFATQTGVYTASWMDVELAGSQGTITSVSLPDHSGNHGAYNHYRAYGKNSTDRRRHRFQAAMVWIIFLLSIVAVGLSFRDYRKMKRKYQESGLKQPLMKKRTKSKSKKRSKKSSTASSSSSSLFGVLFLGGGRSKRKSKSASKTRHSEPKVEVVDSNDDNKSATSRKSTTKSTRSLGSRSSSRKSSQQGLKKSQSTRSSRSRSRSKSKARSESPPKRKFSFFSRKRSQLKITGDEDDGGDVELSTPQTHFYSEGRTKQEKQMSP